MQNKQVLIPRNVKLCYVAKDINRLGNYVVCVGLIPNESKQIPTYALRFDSNNENPGRLRRSILMQQTN